MKQNKLDCCVVRDLLPSYIEELTESETSQQIEEHLEQCTACSELEHNLRTQVPVTPIPKKSLRFLKRVRNNRIASALFAIVIAILIVVLWYFYLFPYSNTDAGRLTAVQDYVASGEVHFQEQQAIGGDIIDTSDSPDLEAENAIWYTIQKGTPVQVVSYTEIDNTLLVSFTVEDDLHSRGILQLSRGLNGRYRPVNASYGTGYNTALIYDTASIWSGEADGEIYHVGTVLAGFACDNVAAVRMRYSHSYFDPDGDYELTDPEWVTENYEKTYPVTSSTFLWVWSQEQLAADLDVAHFSNDTSNISLSGKPVLLDKNGKDITEQYENTENPSWLSLPNEADLRYVYILMFGVLIIGIRAAMQILEH